MKPKVYIETTIVSYLTSRPSRDIVMAGQQQSTSDWWIDHRDRFDLVTSELTILEASAGDPQASAARLAALKGILRLEINDAADALGRELVRVGAIPSAAAPDALHVAIGAINGADYLLTWNFKHIANARLHGKIVEICQQAGVKCPAICTPNALMEIQT